MNNNIISSTLVPDKIQSDTVIVACSRVQQELSHAISSTGCDYPVILLKSRLHDVPENLNAALQDIIDELSALGIKRILMGYATCGNALAGLHSRQCELIFPRCDDCVTFFLGSMKRRREMPTGIFYITSDWATDKTYGLHEYQNMVEEYGEEMAQEVYEMMFEHYRYAGILDTTCCPTDTFRPEAEQFAAQMELDVIDIDGSNDWLTQLLTGPWPKERFFCFTAGYQITANDLYLP